MLHNSTVDPTLLHQSLVTQPCSKQLKKLRPTLPRAEAVLSTVHPEQPRTASPQRLPLRLLRRFVRTWGRVPLDMYRLQPNAHDGYTKLAKWVGVEIGGRHPATKTADDNAFGASGSSRRVQLAPRLKLSRRK